VIVRGDAVGASQREFAAAAEAYAMDRGDAGNLQVRDARENILALLDELAQALPVHLLEAPQVRAGVENALLVTHENDAAKGRAGLDVIEVRVEFGQRFRGEQVGRQARLVEAQDAELIRRYVAVDVVHAAYLSSGACIFR
jgi:hypothetical protein